MTSPVLKTLSLNEFLAALTHPSALLEIAVTAACLATAWGIVRVLRGPTGDTRSVWFGRRLIDGVLFPVLALALAYGMQHLLMARGVPLAVFLIVIPVLASFAAIRLAVRVLTVVFPQSPLVRVAERTISWVAWLAVVGWITGVLPDLLEALDEVRWKMGGSTFSLRTLLEGGLMAGLVLVLSLWISSAIESSLLRGATGEHLSLRKAAANAVRGLLIFEIGRAHV